MPAILLMALVAPPVQLSLSKITNAAISPGQMPLL